MCPYLGSGNPLYAGFYECDLTGRPALCGGDIAHCESPQAREKQEKGFRPIVIVEKEPEIEEKEQTFSEYIHNGVCLGDLK